MFRVITFLKVLLTISETVPQVTNLSKVTQLDADCTEIITEYILSLECAKAVVIYIQE